MTRTTPKRLKVTFDRTTGTYLVWIGEHWVGSVQKEKIQDGQTFTFSSGREDMPGEFTCRRMKNIREELVRRIPRDKYMEILEAKP